MDDFFTKIDLVDDVAIASDYDQQDVFCGAIYGIVLGFRYGQEIISHYFNTKTDEFLRYKKDITKIMQDKFKKVIGWGIVNDYIILKRLGIDFTRMPIDIMLADKLLKFNNNNFDDVCKRYKIEYNDGKDWNLYIKSLIDLSDKVLADLKENTEKNVFFYKYLMPSVMLANWMSYTGIAIDIDRVNTMYDSIRDDNNDIITILKNRYNLSDDFNINSYKHIAYLVYDVWKMPGRKRSTDQNVLQKFVKLNEDVELILLYRRNEKILSILESLKLAKKNNGEYVINSIFNVYGAVTGRWSSMSINLQSIPRDEDMRRCFVARKGYKLIVCDFDQLELRLAAHFSNDKELITAFKNNVDVHQKTAEYLQCDRNIAKMCNYGLIYGAGPNRLYEILLPYDVTIEKAKEFHKKFFERYSGLNKFIKRVYFILRNKKRVVSLLGRTRDFDIHNEKDLHVYHREAVHSIINMSATDLVYILCGELFRYIDTNPGSITPLVQVHDEIVCEVKEDKVDSMMSIIKSLIGNINNIIPLKVPISAKVMVCNSWGDKNGNNS